MRASKKAINPQPIPYKAVVRKAKRVATIKGFRGPIFQIGSLAQVLETSRTSRLALKRIPTRGRAIPRFSASMGRLPVKKGISQNGKTMANPTWNTGVRALEEIAVDQSL